jgi:polyphosphate glucokinase
MVDGAPRSKSLNTLAIDIGGTGIKASVLDPEGRMEHDRVRVDTPYPLSPQKLVLEIERLIGQLPTFDRASAGFPGMVRDGQILSAPHFISASGPAGRPEPKLVRAWNRFDLAAALEEVTGRPARVANDADLQGAAVIEGKGFEVVVTLGTGVGTAFFLDGILLPHFEFSHTPLSKGGTYNELLGEAARRKVGKKKWAKRVRGAIEVLRALTFFDRCYVGGGNAAHLGPDLPEGVTIVDNTAGILGGIRLWERTEAMTAARAASRKVPTRGTVTRKTAPRKVAAGANAAAKKAPTASKAPSPRKAPAARKAPSTRKQAPSQPPVPAPQATAPSAPHATAAAEPPPPASPPSASETEVATIGAMAGTPAYETSATGPEPATLEAAPGPEEGGPGPEEGGPGPEEGGPGPEEPANPPA